MVIEAILSSVAKVIGEDQLWISHLRCRLLGSRDTLLHIPVVVAVYTAWVCEKSSAIGAVFVIVVEDLHVELVGVEEWGVGEVHGHGAWKGAIDDKIEMILQGLARLVKG